MPPCSNTCPLTAPAPAEAENSAGSLGPDLRASRKNAFDGSLVMGVSAFNRATGRDRHRADPLDALLDPATGLIRRELTRDRNCPLCGGRFQTPLFVKKGFPHGRCPDCGLIYVSPVLTEQAAADHYRRESSWVKVLESGPQVDMDRLKYAYGLDAARPHLHGNRLLDVGAGTGLFLKVAAEMGFEPTGLELHRENVRRLRREGFSVVDTTIDQAGFPEGAFDLVSLWEVLEHIVDPRPFLNEITRVMAPGGLILVLVPNVDSLATRLLHEQSGTFGGHSHVNHFNRHTLARLLETAGFTVLEMETVITELGTIDNHLAFDDPYLGSAGRQLAFLTPETIHDHFLGSKLLATARMKPEYANRETP